MSLNLNIGNVSISGLETASTEQIDLIISYLKNVKQNGLSLLEEKEKKYIFRAKFIHLLVNYLLENKVKFYEDKLSSDDFVVEIPEDSERYSYLLNDNKFSAICSRLIVETIAHTPNVKEPKEQDEKSRNILLELKRKL